MTAGGESSSTSSSLSSFVVVLNPLHPRSARVISAWHALALPLRLTLASPVPVSPRQTRCLLAFCVCPTGPQVHRSRNHTLDAPVFIPAIVCTSHPSSLAPPSHIPFPTLCFISHIPYPISHIPTGSSNPDIRAAPHRNQFKGRWRKRYQRPQTTNHDGESDELVLQLRRS